MSTPNKPRYNQVLKTTNYDLFTRSSENRKKKISKHKKLGDSLDIHGFLPAYPIVVRQTSGKRLEVLDGQHRLHFAAIKDLPVYYLVLPPNQEFNVPVINDTQKPWSVEDYADWWKEDNEDYQRAWDFSDKYKLPIGTAFALLCDNTSISQFKEDFCLGNFSITHEQQAEEIADLYNSIRGLSKELKSTFLNALAEVCKLPYFDKERLLKGAMRNRELLVGYNTKDRCLLMLEEIYNYGRADKKPLRIDAQNMKTSEDEQFYDGENGL